MPTVAPLDLEGHCLAAVFLGPVPFFALADGTVRRLDHGHKVSEAHDGLLAAMPDFDGRSLLTGGEDGRVCRVKPDGTVEELISIGRKWINQVAGGPNGVVAAAAGRTFQVRTGDGRLAERSEARTVEGLAFFPKGLRIAAARYNGVSLHFAATDAKPVDLEWKGAHTGVTISPDGAYVVTAMQENALHGWRLADGKHMRMSGYPAKVKSLSWSTPGMKGAARGKWLASSGAQAAIVWPFSGKDGPMGKAPLELGTRGDAMVTAVACHPTEEVVAIGYSDGMVLAARFADGKEALLRRGDRGPVSSMGWSGDGRQLAFGSETGDCGVIDITV